MSFPSLSVWRQSVSPVLVASAGMVSAFLAFGDRVDEVLSSTSFLYAVAAFDMFRLEVLCLIGLLLLGPWLLSAITRGTSSGRRILRTTTAGDAAHTEVVLLLVASLLLTMIGGYYTWRYAVGKHLQLARYEASLGWRIREHLSGHRESKARTLARVGALVFRDDDSRALLLTIEKRSREVAILKAVHAALPIGTMGEIDLLSSICDYDFDRAFCQSEVGRVQRFADLRMAEIRDAYADLAANRGDAKARLERLCRPATSIANCGSVLADIRTQGRRQVYINALARLGPNVFGEQMSEPTRQRIAALRIDAGLDNPTAR